jgi:hypothetical protein
MEPVQMRARKERAIAHQMALKLETATRATPRIELRLWESRIAEFTKPRPWWRFW